MAAPNYTEDLTDITLAESTTDGGTWVAIGGGNIALGAGSDFSMQGTNCVDGKISNTNKGPGVPVTSFSPGADDHVFVWLFNSTPGLCATLANQGCCVVIGTDVSNFNRFHVDGSDTYGARGRVGKCYVVRYVNTGNASPPYRTLTGTPGATPSFVGGTINTTGLVKGSNFGVDAVRYGTGAYLTAGELLSAGDASDNPCTFTGFASTDATAANRWGILLDLGGGSFELQGRFVIGQNNSKTATLARFKASNQNIFFVDTVHTLSNFSQVILDHASTRVEWTNISLVALGTTNPGRLIVNANNPTFVWTGGNNASIGITTLQSNSTLSGVSWRSCGQITANGATMTNSKISGYEGTADTSALVWNANADPNGKLDNSTFTKGTAATHAIEFGTSSPITMTLTNMTFTGFNASNGQNDSTLYIARTTGTVTINIIGGTTPSYKTAGATVVINNAVSLEVNNPSPNFVGARVTIFCNTGGPEAAGTVLMLEEAINDAGVYRATESYNFLGNQPVTIRARKLSYLPFETTGTITTNGLTVTAIWQPDPIA